MNRKNFCHHFNYLPPKGDFVWGTMFNWVGHQCGSAKTYCIDCRRFIGNYVIWQYTIAGCGMLKMDNCCYPVAPGEAFLLTVPGNHTYYIPEKNGCWEFLYLGFSGCEMIRTAAYLREKYGPVSAGFASTQSVELAQQFMNRGSANDIASPEEASFMAYKFLMSMVSGCNLLSEQQHSDIVLKVYQYCLQHLSDELSVANLAAHTGFSRSHFYRLFVENTGKSPHEYVLDLRMRMAKQMLQNANLPVKEVANRCGFAETGYFCRVFKHIYGVTPGDFRDLS